MKYLIWPISLFIAEYFFINFPVYYGLRIQIYLYLTFIFLAIVLDKGKISKDIFSKRIILFICILLGMQLVSMIISYYRIDIPQYNKNPIKTFVIFCSFICSILIHYLVVRLNIKNVSDVNKFLRSGWISLVIILIICFVQLFYVFAPSIFEPIVSLIGKTLEARWGGKDATEINGTGFYNLGSYVQTTQRINGLTEEASSLATQLFVIFVPFLLSSIKNRYNVFLKNRKNILSLYITLVMILLLLMFARTTAGFLFSGIILVLLINKINKIQKTFVVFITVLIGLIIINYNFRSEYITESVNNYLINKDENSVTNRLGSTFALLKISLHNFLLGVGWEYHTYYIFENLPEWAKHNSEYYNFIERKEYPIMSVILSWVAGFGFLIVSCIVTYLIKTQKKFRKYSNKLLELKREESKLIKVLCDSSKYYLIFTLICSLFLYVWYASIYLIVYFFFLSTINVVKKSLIEKNF
ncbi:hypothetical protein ABES38_04110 [Bacillus gobiensis]|uniref:hypothetical protein n=1 Tax=Bacillus gobiensis TaxID=1441095 RepID=UPI003D23315F